MRIHAWLGMLVLSVALVVGCGGNPVDAILKEEKELYEATLAGKVDRQKTDAINRKVSALTKEQQEEYSRRKLEAFMGLLKDKLSTKK